MNREIVTPKKSMTEEKVDFISLEGEDGSFGILKGHNPMLASIKIAPVFYDRSGKREYIAVMGGVVRVLDNTVTIVTEDAERAVEIDELIAKKEKDAAEAYLTRKTEITDMVKVEVQLRKALVRLKVVQTSKRI